MGYERSYRDDRRPRSSYGRDPRYDDSGFAYGAPRDQRAVNRDDRDDDRGFFDRAGDELRSWFGDEEAERRRERDARSDGYARHDSGRDDHPRRPRGGAPHDPGYHDWRRRQIEALDRDYDEYRREHQAKFDSDFGAWRGNRQTQRDSLKRVSEHMEVIGSDGEHVGTVDHVRGDRILLTKRDQDAGGHHHSIPSSWVRSVDDKVTLAKTADQARTVWRDEDAQSALFGGEHEQRGDRSPGPHVLGRSFAGTY